MKRLAERLRKFASNLRKQGTAPVRPKPIGNPVASKTQNDFGSQDIGRTVAKKKDISPPKGVKGFL